MSDSLLNIFNSYISPFSYHIQDTTDSTSVSTGSLINDGGTGIAKNLWVGGDIRTISVENSISVGTGAMIVDGGLSVAKDISIGGTLNLGTLSLTSLTLTGDLTANGDINGDGATDITGIDDVGTVSVTASGDINANGNIVGDSSTNITGINTVTATSLGGTLTTAAQSNVTSLGTLSSVTVSGDVNANGNIVGDSATNITGVDEITANQLNVSGSWVLLSDQTLSASTSVSFTSLITSAYTEYRIEAAFYLATDGSANIVLSEDNGSTWLTGATDYHYSTTFSTESGSTTHYSSTGDSEIELIPSMKANSSRITRLRLFLHDPEDTSRTIIEGSGAMWDTSETFGKLDIAGARDSTGSHDAFKFTTTQNATGFVRLYGLNP